jgi:hypothetical protein
MNIIENLYKFISPKFQNLYLEYKVAFKPRYGHGLLPHAELYSIINSKRDNYKELLNKALRYKETIWEIKDHKNETDASKPSWNNGFLPGLDIIGIYTLLAEFKPKKYVEIFEDKELSNQIEPIWHSPNLKNVERHGGSFWLRIKE